MYTQYSIVLVSLDRFIITHVHFITKMRPSHKLMAIIALQSNNIFKSTAEKVNGYS